MDFDLSVKKFFGGVSILLGVLAFLTIVFGGGFFAALVAVVLVGTGISVCNEADTDRKHRAFWRKYHRNTSEE